MAADEVAGQADKDPNEREDHNSTPHLLRRQEQPTSPAASGDTASLHQVRHLYGALAPQWPEMATYLYG